MTKTDRKRYKKNSHPKHRPEYLRRRKRQAEISNNWTEYKTMWILVMFDMPVIADEDRKNYALFRKNIIKLGFDMFQFSIYTRFSPNMEVSEVTLAGIRNILPPKGKVDILCVTGKQFEKMISYIGHDRQKPPDEPEQLLLF